MPVTLIKSYWSSGNLRFRADPALSFLTNPILQIGESSYSIQSKFHARPALNGSVVEMRSRPKHLTDVHAGIDADVEWRTDEATITGGRIRSLQGVAHLTSTKTYTGNGGLTGVYGQIRADGTVDGSGIHSALEGLLETGGTWTAVSHLAGLWLDSHLAAVPTGETEFIYISNNGAGTIGQAIYVYGGNEITNLLNLNTVAGMVSANTAGGGTLNFTDWRTIKCVIEGETYYLVAAKTIA